MSEENYFETKLRISKDTLSYTLSELEGMDIKIEVLLKRHEYDLELYNQKVKRLQEIKKDMEARIESLQKKIDLGYVAIDMNTGKGYKSKEAMHIASLKQKESESKERYKEMKKKYEAKKRKGEIPRPVVENITPSPEEIESQKERELRLLKERSEELEEQRKLLEAAKKEIEKPVVIIEEPEPIVEIPIPNAEGPIDEAEINKDKVKCPECDKFYTKGGAFTAHYKTHFNGD